MGNVAPPGFRYRAATPRDAVALTGLITSAMDTYRGFAGPGWKPPPPLQQETEMRTTLRRGDTRARVAFDADGGLVGFTGWTPAPSEDAPSDGAVARAHLWALFAAPPAWGTGLAEELHSWSIDGMRGHGYVSAQLWVVRENARARAFYEREGWSAAGGEMHNKQLALTMVRYERGLV